ncbi:MAG TPA: AIR synthase-related protein [Acidobacteriaceae bacterium]|jgi:phosphoribosylformylglycinamidine (FGAM) synthase-like enzyme
MTEPAFDNPRDWAGDLHKLVAEVSASSLELPGSPLRFQHAGDSIILVQPNVAQASAWQDALGATAFAETILGMHWGALQPAEARIEGALAGLLERLMERRFPHSICRIGRGGLAVALAHGCRADDLGVRVNIGRPETESALHAYFGEDPSRLLLTCKGHAHFALTNFIEYGGCFAATAIGRVTTGQFHLEWEKETLLSTHACTNRPFLCE